MDIVIIGAQKAGTTWLFSMLIQQPRIGFSFVKEIHYFDNLYNVNFEIRTYRNNLLSKKSRFSNIIGNEYLNYVFNSTDFFTDQWYKYIFIKKPLNQRKISKGLDVIFLDVTPSYMTMSEQAVSHMARVLPAIEPILIVRDPVRRMISGACMRIARTGDQKKINDVWLTNIIDKHQVPRGSYSTAIPLYKKYFNSIKIIPFKRISTDPLGVLSEISRKYNLNDIEYHGINERRNTQSAKYTLNEIILSHIEHVCEIEYDYLLTEFGSNFLKEI